MIVKIVDTMCSHEPFYFLNTPQLQIVRNLTFQNTLTIQPDDVVIYTDMSLNQRHTCKKRIALMLESQELHRAYYDYIGTHNHLFDVVLTFDKKLLNRGENFRLNLLGTTWLHESYRNIWPKNKHCSLILSNKKITSGHQLRHVIAEHVTNVDVYGGHYRFLPFTTTRAFAPDHTPCHVSNQKYRALKDYRFSIVIENCKEDYYFTEKLIDCFLSGTIPIYYGCPSIGNFFNAQGMLTFTTPEECYSIVNKISTSMYKEKMPFIQENYERAKKYIHFQLEEKYIV
jgi:hypothetical protein